MLLCYVMTQNCETDVGIPFVPVLWILKCPDPVSQNIQFGTPSVPVLFESYEHDVSESVSEYV
jgi:hypothetical protein